MYFTSSSSLFSWPLLLLLTLIFSFYIFRAHCDYPTISCSNTNGNFTRADNFSHNLDNLLANITSATTAAGNSSSGGWFYHHTVGENSGGVDQVNGIALCRGDTTSSECDSCLNDAVTNITISCPNQKEAVLWFARCILRYSNQSILGSLEEIPQHVLYNVNNVPDPHSFNQKLGTLLSSLQTKAANGNATLKFADGKTKWSTFGHIYALVQCTPDLSSIDCNNCIGNSIDLIPSCCYGKQSIYVMKPSCTLRFETYSFYNEPNSLVAVPPRPPPVTSNKGKGSTKGTKVVVAVVVIIVLCLVTVSLVLACCLPRRRRRKNIEQPASMEKIEDVDSLYFNFDTVRAATNDFSDDNKLGRGGFGAVYKGLLSNGLHVAVKRLAKNSEQGETEFKNEVLLLAKLQHKNLVRLLGFCLEKDERILIYEFVPNSSLDYFLLSTSREAWLIGLGDARQYHKRHSRGLLYLHEDSRLRIIHRDLKPSNILLDAAMTPKIADFGLARVFQVDQTQGDTSRVAGTYGYMAPEYAFHGYFSDKSDVYSFGVIVLEMITGRRSIGVHHGENSEDLTRWVWRKWKDGKATDVVDETMPIGPWSDIMRVIHIGLLCVQEEVADRPTMSSVVIMLSSHSITLPLVTHPAYITRSQVPLNSEEHISGVTYKSLGPDLNYDDFSSQLTPR